MLRLSEVSAVVDGWTSDIVWKDGELPALVEDGSCWWKDSAEGSGAEHTASASTILDKRKTLEQNEFLL